jgi:hypothetical protein
MLVPMELPWVAVTTLVAFTTCGYPTSEPMQGFCDLIALQRPDHLVPPGDQIRMDFGTLLVSQCWYFGIFSGLWKSQHMWWRREQRARQSMKPPACGLCTYGSVRGVGSRSQAPSLPRPQSDVGGRHDRSLG